ncbi:4'-phosphopantetheinyl transferase superfamily protein [Mesorhizobium intechi]|nr:4'-phosphopantetheinyl transferase superfamily protein [Mesorhizobium intechi]
MRSLSGPGLLIGRRPICAGDEEALLPSEAVSYSNSVNAVRRQSGAARIVARSLLQEMGHPCGAINRSVGGAPTWPKGIVGSLAHDRETAVAAVSSTSRYLALGIDIEPAEPLPEDLIDIVTTDGERSRLGMSRLYARCLFVLKEAVYKASFPLNGLFLDFCDVEIDIENGIGVVSRACHQFNLKCEIGKDIVGIAYIEARADRV